MGEFGGGPRESSEPQKVLSSSSLDWRTEDGRGDSPNGLHLLLLLVPSPSPLVTNSMPDLTCPEEGEDGGADGDPERRRRRRKTGRRCCCYCGRRLLASGAVPFQDGAASEEEELCACLAVSNSTRHGQEERSRAGKQILPIAPPSPAAHIPRKSTNLAQFIPLFSTRKCPSCLFSVVPCVDRLVGRFRGGREEEKTGNCHPVLRRPIFTPSLPRL